ncbi:MAG: histidinol dehydrogenase [Saprospiraceae bacterium]
MKVFEEPNRNQWMDLVTRPSGHDLSQDSLVENILQEVRSQGDMALKKYTAKFDQVTLTSFIVTKDEIEQAIAIVPEDLKNAILLAKANIETFHSSQIREVKIIETMPGVLCWQGSKPIEKIGIYIPGGTAPLFSTVLMLAVPAKIAGCNEIILCSPPDRNGDINSSILFAAHICGVNKIFKIGGAQAIAAMAYGTKEVPSVYKIFGPGNSFVTAAKMKVQQEGIAIDMPAGPSEVLICADDTADPDWVAIDLLSQAEHGTDSQVVLVTDSKELAGKVQEQLKIQLKELPRKSFASGALNHSHVIILKKINDQIDFINTYAPEHLIINHANADEIANRINNAGSIFIGPYSPESVGDYASGTNHTLPTSAYAKAYSGVNLDSFTKKITYQKLTAEGLQGIGPIVEIMAEAEHLIAHKLAISKRLEKIKKQE